MDIKIEIITLRGTCEEKGVCPAIRAIASEPNELYVQGKIVTDPQKLAAFGLPADEAVVVVPRSLLPEVH